MLRFNVAFDQPSLKYIDHMDDMFQDGSSKGFQKAILIAEAGAKKRSPVLTGHLRRSIRSGAKITLRKVFGWVGSNLIYARIQELGGIIKPKKGKYLKFQIRGQWKSVKSVKIKGKKYLERGMMDNLEKIRNTMRQSMIDTYNKGR